MALLPADQQHPAVKYAPPARANDQMYDVHPPLREQQQQQQTQAKPATQERANPPAGRFNAGEKLVFWFALAGGVAVIVSGYLLIFPFYLTDILGMQIAQVVHAVIALLFVALILAHIYIGTIGMEGAFEAMGEGTVDRNWAQEHHSLWLEEQSASAGANESGGHPAATPAE